jgi:hypothetical protein
MLKVFTWRQKYRCVILLDVKEKCILSRDFNDEDTRVNNACI